MTRYRVFGLSFLLLACLVAAPLARADKDKDKDKDKETKKAAPAKTSSTHHDPQHDSGSQDSGHHGSTSQSSSSSSSSSNSSGSHEHSGESHHHGDVTGQSHTSGDSHDGSETHQSHQAESSQHTHGSHDTSHSTYTSHDTHVRIDSHTTVVVDHARLHERLEVRPGAVERQHAYEHSRAERVLFERHIGAIHFVPAHRVVLASIRIVPTTYYYRRTVFYDTYGWNTPVYVYHLYPRYGLWDATFLAFALDHIAEEQYALMFYHHRHDAEIEQWMDDNDRLAADNENLRAELDEMRAKMDTFEQSGVTADPAYVPVDAQDVALSPEVITQLTSKK